MNVRPDYKHSIVNLIGSLVAGFEEKPSYPPFSLIPPQEIAVKKNIILIVIDGLGFEYIKTRGKGSFLLNNMRGKMTTVFPSTTASAITTFATGLAPAQHGITGWFMWLKELGVVSQFLPFKTRFGDTPLGQHKVTVRDLMSVKPLSEILPVPSYVILPDQIIQSDFTRALYNKATILGYRRLSEFFQRIKECIASHGRKKYIYAYWHEFDALCHEYGPSDKHVEKHFKKIDLRFQQFIREIKDTDSIVIVTSDHGLVDTPRELVLFLEQHPQLSECLSMPLCGEPRLAYCYVHPSKERQFVKYVKTKLNTYCEVHSSESLVKKGYFGLFPPAQVLFDRIGDYVLVMKGHHMIKDRLLGQEFHIDSGSHGGLSKEEMFVPCITIKA